MEQPSGWTNRTAYRMDTEAFIKKAKSIHGENTYDYSKTVYVRSKDEVIVGCYDHGDFNITPNAHISGVGCHERHPWPKKIFIERARKVHGDLFGYDNVNWIEYTGIVFITCRKHGDVEVKALGHVKGTGCYKCDAEAHEEMLLNKKKKKAIDKHLQFLAKAREKHGDRYDYSLCIFVRSHDKVIIICRIHGRFEQIAKTHVGDPPSGCPTCADMDHRKTTEEFIADATSVHGQRYDYSEVVYILCNELIRIICRIHGVFMQIPSQHLSGRGCHKCSKTALQTTEMFIARAITTHGKRYDYHDVQYIASDVKVCIGCYIHGAFYQTPAHHLDGQNCPSCNALRRSVAEYIRDVKKVHGDRYDYSHIVKLDRITDVIPIGCSVHGIFEQRADYHLYSKSNCQKCARAHFSRVSIEWLEFKEVQDNCTILHAMNGKEHRIPNTRFSVDGYSSASNKVYEFLGDFYHGNPQIYDPDDVNKVTKRTFGDLYTKTMVRKDLIISKGYVYEDIWEHDWKRAVKAVVKLQRAWRARCKVEYVYEYVLVFPPKKTKQIP